MTHYALPLYLVEHYGGWTNRKLIEFYIRFAKTIFEKWGDVIDYYLPFNEINAGYFLHIMVLDYYVKKINLITSR